MPAVSSPAMVETTSTSPSTTVPEDEEDDLTDDPELLVSEVEDFLRDTNE